MSHRLPVFRRQIGDPTTSLDSSICTLEAGAMGLDFQTGGAITLWGGQLIPWCGRSTSEIARRGTNLLNVAQAWLHFGQVLDVRSGPWSEVAAERAKGHAIIAQTDYEEYTLATRCQDSFEANHASIFLPNVGPNEWEWLTGDPLCGGYRWVPASEHRRAMEKLALDQRGSRNELFFAVAKHPIALPQTDTEEDMPGLVVTALTPVSGVITVKSDRKYAAIQVADKERVYVGGGTQKRAFAKGKLVPPLDGLAGDRATVYLVGDEAAVFLASDVTFASDASDFNAGVTAASQKALEARR